MRKTVWIAITALLLFACGGEQPTQESALDQIDKGLNQKTGTVSKDAGAMLSPQIIAEALGIDASVITESSKSQRFVGYSWEKADKEAIEAKNQKIMLDSIRNRASNPDAPMPKMLSSDNEVSLATNSFDNANVAATSYKGHVANMKDGIKVESSGESHTFKINYDQPVEGVGAQAAWSTGHHQLAVQHDNLMMFLTVKIADDQDKELAKKIMNHLLGKL